MGLGTSVGVLDLSFFYRGVWRWQSPLRNRQCSNPATKAGLAPQRRVPRNGKVAGGLGCYLSSAVTPEPLEVLSMCQVIGKTTVLKRDSGVNESGSSTVVVHEKRLRTDQ